MTDTAEAPESTETATESTTETAPAPAPSANEQAVTDAVAETRTASNDFDFVLDKYRAEGTTDQEAAMSQAKAYGELHKKFGAFTGAPENYELSLSEDMADKFNFDDFKEDPLIQDFQEMAREMGINNEGANKFLNLFFKQQMANDAALDGVRDEEMKLLGSNAERRVENIQDWAKANLDSEASKALGDSLISASAVQAIEAVIAKTRNAPQVGDTEAAQAINHDELKALLTAKDESGNDKMQDPEYRSMVRKRYGQKFGEEPHNVTVG